MKLLKRRFHRVKNLCETLNSVHFHHINCFIKYLTKKTVRTKLALKWQIIIIWVMSIKNGPFWWLRHARRTFIFTKSPRQSQFLSSGKQKLWPKIFHCQWHDRMSDHYFLARLKRFRTLSLNNLLHMIEFLMIRSCSTN